MNVSQGSVSEKARTGWLVRTSPVVENDKSFTIQSKIYKPIVTGDGYGQSSLSFQSTGSLDDESAAVRWVVSEKEKVSKLVFVLRSPDGTIIGERGVKDIKGIGTNKLTVRLNRKIESGKTRYSAFYRTGDGDSEWMNIGNEEDGSLGGDGNIVLSTSNTGIEKKFPKVIGRFDSVSGSVQR
jgi:hypothetical protein